jgi:hypothetical protein
MTLGCHVQRLTPQTGHSLLLVWGEWEPSAARRGFSVFRAATDS